MEEELGWFQRSEIGNACIVEEEEWWVAKVGIMKRGGGAWLVGWLVGWLQRSEIGNARIVEEEEWRVAKVRN